MEIIPIEIKELVVGNGFKKAIKKPKPANCPCNLCKPYIYHVVSYLNYALQQKSKLYLNFI